ncbi:hypothetical protein [Chlamydia vaughanii]|uniref:hypothetical protein n=1 Tax=Chlamydia vaughanii TaxID=3112552 RepID=UPI0032B15CF1
MYQEILPQPLSSEYQKQLYISSRSVAMIAMAAVFFTIALILSGLSFLPQATLPFSGAYYVMGSFLVFIAAGILLVNTLCNQCSRPRLPLPPS